MTNVRTTSSMFRFYAEHFVQRDWDYTRDLGNLKAIKYDTRYDSLPYRIRHALPHLWPWPNKHDALSFLGPHNWKERLIFFKVGVTRDPHLPDGVLDNGSIITFWEETGEYLQLVQPSVGSLLADWMDAEPNNPHAVWIAEEIDRIMKRYTESTGAKTQ